jgi:hypothetical protein
MSSYGEMKKDAGYAALGIILVMLVSLAFQITFLICCTVFALVVIGISRLVQGKDREFESTVKLISVGLFYFISVFSVVYFFTKYFFIPVLR